MSIPHPALEFLAANFGVLAQLERKIRKTWQLRSVDKLLDIVDPELVEYPEDEVLRFIMVALICTQATSHQRPNMKQVVEMLQSTEIDVDVRALRQPGVVKEAVKEPHSFVMTRKLRSSPLHKDSQSKSTYGFNTTAEDSGSSPLSTFEIQPR